MDGRADYHTHTDDGDIWNPELLTFATYIANESEVTDAVFEAGVKAYLAARSSFPRDWIEAAFQAMIAAKHEGMLPAPVDPVVEALAEVTGQGANYTDERDAIALREALAKRGKMIADIPVEAPAIDEEAVLREAREAIATVLEADGTNSFAEEYRQGTWDNAAPMQALIAMTRRAMVAEGRG